MSSQKAKKYRLFFSSMEKCFVKSKTKEKSNFLSVIRFWEKQIFFGRNIEESLVMLFSKTQAKYQEISKKDFDPLLGQVDYDLWQPLAGKGVLCDLALLAGCPWRNSLCFARDRAESLPQKATCRGREKQILAGIVCRGGRQCSERKKEPVVISIRTTGLSFGLTGLGENNLRDIKKHFSFVPIWTIRQSFWLTMVWKQVLGYRNPVR